MKLDDQEFDRLLQESLSREEAELFQRLGSPSMFDVVTSLFRGSLRRLNLIGYVLGIVVFAAGVGCLVGFLQADDPATLIRWGLGVGCALLFTMMLKVWFWMELQQYVLSREIKRLQLQVAHLTAALAGPAAGPAD